MTLDVLERTDVEAGERPDADRARPSRTGIIDGDVHPTLRSLEDLRPHLSRRWWDHLQTWGMRSRHGLVQGYPYPKACPGANRRDATPPTGGPPGSDLAFMREQYLDPYGIEHAILGPLMYSGQGEQDPGLGAAMCRAINDWQRATWTRRDPRLKASIVVPYEDGLASQAEIERCAPDPDFAQVFMLTRTTEPLGKRRYWPIYQAAAAHGLPVAIHVFGFGGHATTPGGWPSYYVEDMTAHSAACQAAIASLVLEGVFERVPELKIVKIEGGFGWLPSLAWRLDKHWARLRDEVPHVKRPPSSYIRDHVWVTSQPIEEPERGEHLIDLIEWLGADRLLLATDYPHWDFDDPTAAFPRRLGPDRLEQIRRGNAREVYRLG